MPSESSKRAAFVLATKKLATPIHSILRPPRVLVLLGAAKKIERHRAVDARLLDRVRDDRVADRDLLEIGIVAAEVVVDGVVMREAVENRTDRFADPHRVHAQCAGIEHALRGVAMK